MRFITVKRISLGSVANGHYDKKLHFRPLKRKEISIGYILCLDGSTNGDFLIEQFTASAKVTKAIKKRRSKTNEQIRLGKKRKRS